jgi:mono/diheme cytochrome c family protein
MRLVRERFKSNCPIIFVALALTAIVYTSLVAQVQTPLGKTPGKNKTSDSASTELSAAIARGSIVYKDQCAICHFNESDAKKIGPGLKDICRLGKFPDGGKVDDASMQKWILNGGKNMPPFKAVLGSSQVRDLISYLKTL